VRVLSHGAAPGPVCAPIAKDEDLHVLPVAVTYTEFRGLTREALMRVVENFPETQRRFRVGGVWFALARHIIAITAEERASGPKLLGENGHKPDFLDYVYRAVRTPWRERAIRRHRRSGDAAHGCGVSLCRGTELLLVWLRSVSAAPRLLVRRVLADALAQLAVDGR
jgi:hypothetical protein